MPDIPQTDRSYAYFCVKGTFDPKDITKLLGIEPDDSWELGDNHQRGGRTFQRRFSVWKRNSGHDDKTDLDQHLKTLIHVLTPLRSELLHISTFATIQFVCVGFYLQSFDWVFSADLIQKSAALGVDFWFDTYSLGDPHEEIADLHEALQMKAQEP